MSLGSSRSRLLALTKELLLKWGETREQWKDAKSQEFGREYMEQLLLHVEKAVSICDRLDRIINKARNDCE